MSKRPEDSPDLGYGQGITPEEWKEIKDWWLGDIVPKFKPWTPVDIQTGATFLRRNKLGAKELIRSKFKGSTRLVIIGMQQSPQVDNLPDEILEEIPQVDFIAVEVRDPKDQAGGFEEDKKGFATVNLGDGVLMQLSHEEARKKYPGQYRDPDQRDTSYDNSINLARASGIDVIYTAKGSTWKDMNRLAAQEVASYMNDYPNARGIYFSSIYSALKWPGYNDDKEREALEFNRPLTTANIFDTNPRTDESVRMPAYELGQQFPGEVYSMAQFVMPRGYGAEWKNLRSAVEEAEIPYRFMLDDIVVSPFAVQRDMFIGLAEIADEPIEDLWKYYGTIAQGFFGPRETRWDKVLDGVLVYPSNQALPKPPTQQEIMKAAMPVVAEILEDLDKK